MKTIAAVPKPIFSNPILKNATRHAHDMRWLHQKKKRPAQKPSQTKDDKETDKMSNSDFELDSSRRVLASQKHKKRLQLKNVHRTVQKIYTDTSESWV